MSEPNTERWLPVVGYEELYEVSDIGNVRRGQKMLKPVPQVRRRAARVVNLCRNGQQKTVLVHRLVLEAFVGPCPPGLEACHGNDVAWDNRLENLRWDTSSANHHDCVRNGKHHNANRTHCSKHGQEYHQPSSGGRRYCKKCKSEWNAKHNNKRRATTP